MKSKGEKQINSRENMKSKRENEKNANQGVNRENIFRDKPQYLPTNEKLQKGKQAKERGKTQSLVL